MKGDSAYIDISPYLPLLATQADPLIYLPAANKQAQSSLAGLI